MISKGSCDTEAWSNDAKNSALPSQEYFTSQYYCFYCIFDQMNAALVSIRDFFQKHQNNAQNFDLIIDNLFTIYFY